MKKPLEILAMITAATAVFSSCQQEKLNGNTETGTDEVTKTINAYTGIDTKVWVDGNDGQFRWHPAGDRLAVMEICGDGSFARFETEDSYTLDEDCRNAVFTVKMEAKESDNYVYTAVYPSSGCGEATDINDIVLTLPEKQTPSTDNYDPSADLMVSKAVTSAEQAAPAVFTFNRIAAIARMNITGIPAGEKISSITVTAPDNFISGTVHMNAEDGSVYTGKEEYPFGTGHSISLDMKGSEATGNDVAWFTMLPADLSDGGKMTVSVTTDKGQYTKTLVTEGKELEFISGDLTKFSVALEVSVLEPLETPIVTATADGKTVTVKWSVIDGAGTYSVTCGDKRQDVYVSTEATFEMEYGQTYDVSVTALPSDDSVNSPSVPGTTTVTTGEEPVKEKSYVLLTDEADLRAGDEIIIMGTYANYYDNNFKFTLGTRYSSGPAIGELYGEPQPFNGQNITEVAANTIVWAVESGMKDGTFALKSTNNTGTNSADTFGQYLTLTKSAIEITGKAVTEDTSLRFEVAEGSTYVPGACSISSEAAPSGYITSNAEYNEDYEEYDQWFSIGSKGNVYVYYCPLAPRN